MARIEGSKARNLYQRMVYRFMKRMLGRVPELYVTALGTLRAGAVFCPLFSAFGPEPIASRVGPGDGRVLVTTTRFYERKVKPIREKLPSLLK